MRHPRTGTELRRALDQLDAWLASPTAVLLFEGEGATSAFPELRTTNPLVGR